MLYRFILIVAQKFCLIQIFDYQINQLHNKIVIQMTSNKKPDIKIDPQTGLKERTVDLDDFMALKNFHTWLNPTGNQLFQRIHIGINYLKSQEKQELWLYNRRMLTGVSTEVLVMDEYNNIVYGINFASADYLGLAQNEFAKQAAIEAAKEFGVNSAGSPLALGATKYYMQLKQQLGEFWQTKNILIYSAGWLAGFGVIKGLIRQWDHVLLDQLAHNCLQQGANAATKKIHKFKHLSYQDMVDNLKKIRQIDPENAILVVTEGLFSMDSDTPDLNLVQKTCKQYKAYLLLDCAHDFGCMGENGRGMWQVQQLKDRSNIIMIGTGSKTLSTNIGFAACQDPAVIEFLKYSSTAFMFTNAINPVQAATSLANLRILRSQLGKQKRKQVIENYSYLRKRLQDKGYKVYGNPSPILPLHVGNEIVCRLLSRLMLDNGVHVNGIQWPVVKLGCARLRVNLMPQHTKQHLDTFVEIFEKCLNKANQIFQKSLVQFEEKQNQQKSKL